jgi:hypothetical protein
MKRFTVIALLCVIALAACSPNLFAPVANNNVPTANIAGTVNSIQQTSNAQTLTAQPSLTPTIPATETFTVTPAEPSATPVVNANTDTPIPNLTTTPATATSGPVNPAVTSTPTLVPGQVTASPTNGIMTYGTLPPANRPYVGATLINKSQREAYISLQVVTDQGYTIIEYPVKTVVKVKIPTGDYTYVAWVGGRQMIGYFKVGKGNDVTITIFKDKIVISQASYP